MLIKTRPQVPTSEITDPEAFKIRRSLIKGGLLMLAATECVMPKLGNALVKPETTSPATLTPTPKSAIENYTNYYEYSYTKEDSTQLAQTLPIDPWSIEISGEIAKPGCYHLEDLLQKFPTEERIYRFRCVEAWAMVVPWLGFPLQALIKQVQPNANARFVEFTSILAPESMPNMRLNSLLNWPYTEALRIDEAVHPLTLLATGLYGAPLAKQNGAPIRLVVPWKYGFKNIKAIVKIHFTQNQPISSWSRAVPDEYGFYANVNPNVAHPRWSQATERLIGSRFFTPRRQTELFNGYGEQVANLYSNINLKRYF